MLSPYEVVTFSLNVIGSAVADVQALVELAEPVDVVVRVVVVRVVLDELPHSPLPVTQEAGTRTRGSPDTIGTGMLPFDPTWMEEHVYTSTSAVPELYPWL
jgi:hypothetical protein